MLELVRAGDRIPAMTPAAIEKVRELETINREAPQLQIDTHHVIHGGMYARSIKLEPNTLLTGAMIKKATILIVVGHVIVYVGHEAQELQGHHVIAASAGRKQAFVTKSETYLTMIFATKAKSVVQAEDEFTDEADMLFSRHNGNLNHVILTGE